MTTLLIACGALAREIIAIRDRNAWDAKILALPALLHNTPEKIPGAVAARIKAAADQYERVIVVYGDCGTSGALDAMLGDLNVERIDGPHCYEQYAGAEPFAQMMAEQPGTFFLTDYLTQSFDHLVLEGLGLDRHPELRDVYFGNYRRMIYLKQREDDVLMAKAEAAAAALNLPLEVVPTGYTSMEDRIKNLLEQE